jgi:tRNA 5-methylaminomethyl-2-thiouridine biosynthesis bifunctional protein
VLDADAVVIANASAATQFSATSELPLKSIRGQITHVPAKYLAQTPATVICHEGYLTPSLSGATIGATFNLRDNEPGVRADDHLHNLQTLHAALPSVLAQPPTTIDCTALQGRVGFRCTTPDYLPIVGAVPDTDEMRLRFAALAKNAQRVIAKPGAYIPGLYVNVGHGSRGLTSTPLCAELLAAHICNEPRPLPRDLMQALSPARFAIRKLIRG